MRVVYLAGDPRQQCERLGKYDRKGQTKCLHEQVTAVSNGAQPCWGLSERPYEFGRVLITPISLYLALITQHGLVEIPLN